MWTGIAVAVAAVAIWAGRYRAGSADTTAPPARALTVDAHYVGSAACGGCHSAEARAWQASQHRQAMLPAGADSVAGDFDNASFSYAGVTTTFFRRDGGYWVRTDGADGKLADFRVSYTFGLFPLQQYLIEMPRGHVQALSIAWDARPKAEGGQRWFHLYPDEGVDFQDELHWTGRQQNWNFMCADCHSTDVRKGYDAATDTFQTTWSEIDVGCEACHGPGSRHVDWANTRPWIRALWWRDNGLGVEFDERRGVTWGVNPATSQPARSRPRTSAVEIDTCAHCHARRGQIADGYAPGLAFDDFYTPATLDAPLYEEDGQPQSEVYVYGSFLQSRMQHAGVTCADCHDPHTGRPRVAGNALCTRCHAAARYDMPAHHHHDAGSAGAACVACHMPARTYMQVDSRRDHSFRVPRPDQAAITGAPDVCTSCHTSQAPAWAAARIRAWYGHDASGFQDFADAFHAADVQAPDAASTLAQLAAVPAEPAIVRASALVRMAGVPGRATLDAARAATQDGDPLVRRAALRALGAFTPGDRAGAAIPLLTDISRSVRIEAARLLAPSLAQLTPEDRARFGRAAAELVASERFNANRPERRTALGTFFAETGRLSEAIDEFQAAERLRPTFVPAYANLADAYRMQGDEPRAAATLREGIARVPESADLQYTLGLSLVRAHQAADAEAAFAEATRLAPEVPRFAYTYAIALSTGGRGVEAMAVLTRALARHPDDRNLLFAAATLERDDGRLDAAREYAARLLAAHPDDTGARALSEALK